MDAAILAVAPAAQRQQDRSIAQVDAELLLDRAAQLGTGQRGGEPRETRPIFQTLDWIAAVTADLRKIADQRRHHLAPQKLLDDDEFERVADERCGAQAVEIEDAQPLRLVMAGFDRLDPAIPVLKRADHRGHSSRG